jgi:L-lactate dehydrogenase (cytochrome)
VVKACALGARAAMFGRPYLYGLGAAGELGVEWVTNYFVAGIARTMALVGATDLAALRGSARVS